MRCTISQHQVTIGEGHLDVFFESENVLLETYEASLELMPGFLKGEEIVCHKKKDHRTLYLDFEGELSQNRGFIKIVWNGEYRISRDYFPEIINVKIFDDINIKLEF